MTFGKTTFGKNLSGYRLMVQKQLWIWPLFAVVLLGTVGYFVNQSIRRTMEEMLESELKTLLNVEQKMLEKWFKVQESRALSLANDPYIRQEVISILEKAQTADTPADQLTETSGQIESSADDQLSSLLDFGMSSHDFVGYVVADRHRIVAAYTRQLVGQSVPKQYEEYFARTMDGMATVSTPIPSVLMLQDKFGNMRSGVPTMFVCAPIRGDRFQVVAVLAMRIRPEKEFTEVLQLGQIGKTGETYAVNRQGTMVSNSRFDEDLMLEGLLPDAETSESILNIEVRDPGGSMRSSDRPRLRRKELPLTYSCAAVTSGSTGVNVAGYRNYRGEMAVGAWTWLEEYKLGLITEIEAAEAFRPLTILQSTFYALFGLLAVSAVAIFVFTLVVARLQRQARKAAIEAKQLGQYRLLEKIGEGAMGVVYMGQHAMLRRPTAIKLLDVDRVNQASIERFEREVQITCKLNNPHTVAIYDYGRTPEGVFYYAMEYLDGIDLQKLVDTYGPQPEGRVISILQQICASLYEAHSLGLVHRDIKPANIMLNRRGGEPDIVKVLDFGLVKALGDSKAPGSVNNDPSGTPLYMSPEAIQTPDLVDGRSDLYALGAVGYFLLTGQVAFQASTLVELCQRQITAIPDAPSQRLGRPISEGLEHAILSCLEKLRAKRPQTARDLAAMLERVPASWTVDEAEGWWSRHERSQNTYFSPSIISQPPTSSGRTSPYGPDGSSVKNAGTDTATGNLEHTAIFKPRSQEPPENSTAS